MESVAELSHIEASAAPLRSAAGALRAALWLGAPLARARRA